ncbi:MAG: hypothetical protein R5N60_08585 [Cutibacterium granulosum]|nr:hypothetical protein [Cutibacterium granulosum]MEA5639322.1 hypothetical protein [Cutibacterium granulosum]MEA5647470.1 hypothetical protein [Cutibacterium granulosum]
MTDAQGVTILLGPGVTPDPRLAVGIPAGSSSCPDPQPCPAMI